jgi:methyltransferase OMS1, mitochondrial
MEERLGLVRAKRRRLVKEAYGNVLEVSVGTGRNMDLYDLRPYTRAENESTGRSRGRQISSLTFNDQSDVMVNRAKDKFDEMESAKPLNLQFSGKVRFLVGDAGMPGVIERPPGGYDTIIQTMGICSAANAVELLQRLGKLCRQPGETSAHPDPDLDDGRGGKILLLEHGRGTWGFINRFLDTGAKMHAAHYGCWWNKDIEEVVKESGLVVDRMRRYNFGTTWEIVLRPRAAPRPAP